MLFWNIFFCLAIEIFPQCITATQPSVDETIILDVTTPSVTFTSPGFASGTYPANTNYRWEIVTTVPQKIKLTFQVFSLEYHPQCIWDYLRLSDNNCLESQPGTSTQRLCGIKTSLEYVSTGGVICVEFHSDIINQWQGFEALANIEEVNTSSTVSTWQPTTTSEASLLHSVSTPQTNYNSAVTIQPSTTISPSQVETFYDKSQSSSHQTSEQFSSLVSESHISSNLQTPPASIHSSPVSSVDPVTKPHALTTDSAHEDIDTIFLSTTMTSLNSLSSSWGTSQSTTSSINASGLDPLPTIDVTLAEGSMNPINVVTYSEIRIKTPKDATGKYPVNFHSVLSLYNLEKRHLNLTFDSFRLESSYYCSWDYLLIFTPQSSGPLCGYTVPKPIETDSESVQLQFHSDLIVPDVGFVIRIKVDHPGISTQPLSTLSTEMSSSIGPSVTPTFTSLLQHGTTATSSFIMETSKLQLTKDPAPSSSIESLTISTQIKSLVSQDTTVLESSLQTMPILPTTTATLISYSTSLIESTLSPSMSYAGTITNHVLHSSKTLSPTLTVQPSHVPTSSFLTTASKVKTTESSASSTSETPTTPLPEINVCAFSDISVSATPEIIVKSPRDENGHYPVNLLCQMKIMNSEHKSLKVQFTEFRVEQNSFCNWDYLIIYTSAKYGPMCGYQLPPALVTNSDEITLTFRSDAIIPDTGFVMHINVQQDSTNQSSSTATETTTSYPMSSPKTNNTLINKPQTSTDPSVYNVTQGQTTPEASTISLIPVTSLSTVSSGPTEPQSKTSPFTTVISTEKTSLLTVITLSTPSSTKQSSQSSGTSIPTSASVPVVGSSSYSTHKSTSTAEGPNETTTNSGARTLPTTVKGINKELDICSQDPLEMEDNLFLTSPGFSNGLDYPLNVACNKTLKGNIGENIVLTIEAFDVEQNSVCLWDALNIQFKDQDIKLCGHIIPGQVLDSYASCEAGNFVQYSYDTNSRVCFLNNDLSHTFIFTTTETLTLRFRSDHIVTRQGFKILLHRTKASTETPMITVSSPADTSETKQSKFRTTPQASTVTTKILKTSVVSPLTSSQTPKLSSDLSYPTQDVSSYTSTTVSKLFPTTAVSPTPKLSSDQQPFHDGSGSKTYTMTSPVPTAATNVSSIIPSVNVTKPPTAFTESTKSNQVTNTIKLSTTTTNASPGNTLTSTAKSSLTLTSIFNPTSLTSIKSSLLTMQFTSSASNFNPKTTTDSTTTTAEGIPTTNSPGKQETKAITSASFSSQSPLESTISHATSASVIFNQTESTSYWPNDTVTDKPSSMTTKSTSVITTASNLTQSSSMTLAPTKASDSSSTTSSSIDPSLTPACSPSNEPLSLLDDIGYIESPKIQNKTTYRPNLLCRWKIKESEAQFVSLIFEWFDIEQSSGCRLDKLGIYQTLSDNETQTVAILCGDKLPQTIRASGDVLIEFQSNAQGEKTGFRLKFIKTDKIYEDPTLNCLPGMTPCWTNRICMPGEWICDGEVNCPDMSDEAQCSVCGESQFSCGEGTCIDQTQRCDGYQDCPYGLDEQDCVYLGDKGVVTIIVGGKPLPLCYSQTVHSNGNLLCHASLSRRANKIWSEYTGSVLTAGMAMMSVQEETMVFTESTSCLSNFETRLQCHNHECGVKSYHFRRKRIIGGTLSEDGAWPWTVALMAGTKMICAGNIIDKEWVLTAGHCVQDLQNNPQIGSIVAGVSDINDVNSQIRYVTEVLLHPDYFYIFKADIALLKLDRPLIFNNNVKQICLPWDGREFSLSSRCFIAGWGVSDMSEYYVTVTPKYLRHAKTKLVSFEQCNASYSTYSSTDIKIKKEMICAGYSSGAIDACKGDSGGGLMCQVRDGRWVVAGVTSWGELCGSTNKPGVYTKVAAYIHWINQTLDGPGQQNVNCTFETSDLCGYQTLSSGKYIWTRKPGGKHVTGYILYAIRADSNLSDPQNATLVTPQFNTGAGKCLGFKFLFSINSNITLSIYGIVEGSETQENKSKEILVWHVTSHHPMKESWLTSEADVPGDVTRLKFVSQHDRGIITGLGLDNVTLTLTSCSASDFMKCNFDNQTFCQYSNPTNTIFNKQWKIKHRSKSKPDCVLETGGNYSEFGYMAVSQFVSPALTSTFTSLPHCLTFSYHKVYYTSNELKVVTYSRIGQTLTNQKVFWSSKGSEIGQWNSGKVSIVRGSEYFDHIVFEVRRAAMGNVRFMVDNIGIYDGYCL